MTFKKGQVSLRKGVKLSEETKRKISIARLNLGLPDQNGELNPNWKGEDIGYHGVHRHIRLHLPKPEDGLCQFCHKKPLYDAACVTQVYNRDFENWRYLCHSCNKKHDNLYKYVVKKMLMETKKVGIALNHLNLCIEYPEQGELIYNRTTF